MKHHKLLIDAVNRIGRTHALGSKLKEWITAAGYEKVPEEAIWMSIRT